MIGQNCTKKSKVTKEENIMNYIICFNNHNYSQNAQLRTGKEKKPEHNIELTNYNVYKLQ